MIAPLLWLLVVGQAGVAPESGSASASQTVASPQTHAEAPVAVPMVEVYDAGMQRVGRVPDLQAAVAAAVEGGTLVLDDGVFSGPRNRDVLIDKNLTIRSRNGRDATTIDCLLAGRAFRFSGIHITGESAVLGLTIVNGKAVPNGGAIWTQGGARPTIADCRFVHCEATGGGALFYQGLLESRGEIRGCVFSFNHSGEGGAVKTSDARIDRCVFDHNTTSSDGGAVFVIAKASITNSLFFSNEAAFSGGAILAGGSSTTDIHGCTIVNNHAGAGGGLSLGRDSSAVVSNVILWNNTASFGNQAVYTVFFGNAHPTFDHCLIQDGASGVGAFVAGSPGPGAPMFVSLLSGDPSFVDAAAHDYRITEISPALDAGNPAVALFPNEADVSGQPRPAGAAIDIGSDELGSGLVVSLPSPGRSGGTSRIAIESAPAGSSVHLFSGWEPGSTPVGFGGCPSLTLDLQAPALLAVVTADAEGSASVQQHVPHVFAGMTVLFQAIGLHPGAAVPCQVSNLVHYTFD